VDENVHHGDMALPLVGTESFAELAAGQQTGGSNKPATDHLCVNRRVARSHTSRWSRASTNRAFCCTYAKQ